MTVRQFQSKWNYWLLLMTKEVAETLKQTETKARLKVELATTISEIMSNEKTIMECIIEGGFLMELKAVFKRKLGDMLNKFDIFQTYKDIVGDEDVDKDLDVEEMAAMLSKLPVIGPLLNMKFDEAFETFYGIDIASVEKLENPGSDMRKENLTEFDA